MTVSLVTKMNSLSVILFVSSSILLAVGAVYLMTSTLRDLPEERPWHPMADGGVDSPEFKKYMKTITRRVHPEMVDVELEQVVSRVEGKLF